MNDTSTILIIINTFLIIAATLGGIFAFFRANQSGVTEIQEKTILALQQQMTIIQQKLEILEKDNERLRQVIDTIQAGLRAKGIHITIDGDMVTINDASSGSASTLKRRPHKNIVMTKLETEEQ